MAPVVTLHATNTIKVDKDKIPIEWESNGFLDGIEYFR